VRVLPAKPGAWEVAPFELLGGRPQDVGGNRGDNASFTADASQTATIDQSSSSPADSPPSPAPPEEAVTAPEDDGEMHTMPVYEEPGPPQPAPLLVEQAEL